MVWDKSKSTIVYQFSKWNFPPTKSKTKKFTTWFQEIFLVTPLGLCVLGCGVYAAQFPCGDCVKPPRTARWFFVQECTSTVSIELSCGFLQYLSLEQGIRNCLVKWAASSTISEHLFSSNWIEEVDAETQWAQSFHINPFLLFNWKSW